MSVVEAGVAFTCHGKLLLLAHPLTSNKSIGDEKIRISKLGLELNPGSHQERSSLLTRPSASSAYDCEMLPMVKEGGEK